MTTIADLRRELMRVPTALLGPDERRVREEALTSLDALANFDIVPAAVAFVGSSGAGKSTIFNACVGDDVSAVSVARPTTLRTLMAGSSGPVSLSVESEYVLVPGAEAGVVFIDTPSWEHDAASVASVMNVADLVVVVLTPSRYADASVAELVADLPERRPSAVVVNRIDAPADQVEVLMESVRDLYGTGVVELEENGDVRAAAAGLLEDLAIDTIGYQRGAVLRAAGSSGARFLAGAVTSLSTEIGALQTAVEETTVASVGSEPLPVLETWEETRAALVNDARRRVTALDADLALDGNTDIASRLRLELEPWDGEVLSEDLDRWRADLSNEAVKRAKMRWRKSAGAELITHNIWKGGVHPGLTLPKRVQRVLGQRLNATVEHAHTGLVGLLDAAVEGRRQQWLAQVDALGDYAPGELLAAAEGFSPRSASRG